jgi:hypothetical protein
MMWLEFYRNRWLMLLGLVTIIGIFIFENNADFIKGILGPIDINGFEGGSMIKSQNAQYYLAANDLTRFSIFYSENNVWQNSYLWASSIIAMLLGVGSFSNDKGEGSSFMLSQAGRRRNIYLEKLQIGLLGSIVFSAICYVFIYLIARQSQFISIRVDFFDLFLWHLLGYLAGAVSAQIFSKLISFFVCIIVISIAAISSENSSASKYGTAIVPFSKKFSENAILNSKWKLLQRINNDAHGNIIEDRFDPRKDGFYRGNYDTFYFPSRDLIKLLSIEQKNKNFTISDVIKEFSQNGSWTQELSYKYEICIEYLNNETECKKRDKIANDKSVKKQSGELYEAFLKYKKISSVIDLMFREKITSDALAIIDYSKNNTTIDKDDEMILSEYANYLNEYSKNIKNTRPANYWNTVSFTPSQSLNFYSQESTNYFSLIGLTIVTLLISYTIFSRKTF